jgi:hypothetical protein
MKFLTPLLFILFLCVGAEAAQFSLNEISISTFDSNIQKITSTIANDDTNQEVLRFDKNQSFLLENYKKQRLGYLIPVKFNSKFYKNTICRLYFLDLNNGLKYEELFAEKNEGDDVVSSCVGIEAVSLQEIATNEANYLAVLRYRTVNTYGSRGVVVNYKNGSLHYDKKLNDCVGSSRKISSIGSLKKKILSCKQSH